MAMTAQSRTSPKWLRIGLAVYDGGREGGNAECARWVVLKTQPRVAGQVNAVTRKAGRSPDAANRAILRANEKAPGCAERLHRFSFLALVPSGLSRRKSRTAAAG